MFSPFSLPFSTLLGARSLLEDKLLKIRVDCPRMGTAVLKGLRDVATKTMVAMAYLGAVNRLHRTSASLPRRAGIYVYMSGRDLSRVRTARRLALCKSDTNLYHPPQKSRSGRCRENRCRQFSPLEPQEV